jgi:hypothetical protein
MRVRSVPQNARRAPKAPIRRAFWGTDLTRIWTLIENYRQCVTLFTEELDFLSGDDLDWVMGRGLTECLDWKLAD